MRTLLAALSLLLLIACGGVQDVPPPKITSLRIVDLEGRAVRWGEEAINWTATFEGSVTRVTFEIAGQKRDLPTTISGKAWASGPPLTEPGVARLTVEGPGGVDVGEYAYEVQTPKVTWEKDVYEVCPGEEYEMMARVEGVAGPVTTLGFFPRELIRGDEKDLWILRTRAPEEPYVWYTTLIWPEIRPDLGVTCKTVVSPWAYVTDFRCISSDIVPARIKRGGYADFVASWKGTRATADINGIPVPKSGDVVRIGPIYEDQTFILTVRPGGGPQEPRTSRCNVAVVD